MPYANNKGTDQPAHPRSLISPFTVHSLDNTCHCYVLNFKTSASFGGCAGRFVSYLVANPEDRFSSDKAQFILMPGWYSLPLARASIRVKANKCTGTRSKGIVCSRVVLSLHFTDQSTTFLSVLALLFQFMGLLHNQAHMPSLITNISYW